MRAPRGSQLNWGVRQQHISQHADMLADLWITSNGGPLLLLPRSLLAHWSGIDASPDGGAAETKFRWNPDQPSSDYDRACDVEGYTGTLPVGGGWGLVIGDEPNPARWVSRPDGGIVVRWEYGPNDEAVEQVVDQLPDELPWRAEGEFCVASSPLEMFDAAEPGIEPLMPRLVVDLTPGTHRVGQTRYSPDPEIALHLIRLRRA